MRRDVLKPAALIAAASCVAALAAGCATSVGLGPEAGPHLASDATAADRALPRYDHVVVIVEENKNYAQILDPHAAPNISQLAGQYGDATQFYSEVHPSEANYVALLGGDTFGIHDDDAYYCKPADTRPRCPGATQPGYVDHTVGAPHLGDQLVAAGLSWKGYYETIPEAGSTAVIAGDPQATNSMHDAPLYASKHSGFMNFASVQPAAVRTAHIVGFDQFDRDLAADALPSFALVVPNQCNEMHGVSGPDVPADCQSGATAGLIARGDAEVGRLVAKLQASAAWRGAGNMAIVVTFDEGSGKTREGCCGATPGAPSNFGGGHIPTVVITNHGPRGVSDATPYSHYSMLRTFEDVFRLPAYLGHADDTAHGVQPMTRLFAVP